MTDGPQTYESLLDDMDTKLEEMINDLVEKANWAGEKLADAANGFGAFVGDVFGDSEAKKALDRWNSELQPAIQEGINTIRDEVATQMAKYTGEPLVLIEYSDLLITAKKTMYQSETLDQEITNLGNTWEGPAYSSYQTVATGQSDALLALCNNLQDGGRLCRAGADAILQLWLDLAQQFVDYAGDAISTIGGLADVGKALGAWISVIADAIALIWQNIGKLAITLATFWKNQRTEAEMNWLLLDSGTDGLPQNHWPMISESSDDNLNDPRNWPAA